MAAAEELQIASVRRDGTLQNRVTIWVVRHGDDLYVRSYRGLNHEEASKQAKACHTMNSGSLSPGVVEPNALRKSENVNWVRKSVK
ncbi:MAG: DUF2255 family protein [Candidatus Binatia bacterium]